MTLRFNVVVCFVAGVSMVMLACATRQPIFLQPDLASQQIQTIALLPIVDRRLDRSYEVDLEEAVRDRARKALEKKGYRVVLPANFGIDAAADATYVAEMDDAELPALVPKGADAAAIVYVEDILSDYKVLYYRFKIETSGTIVSRTGVLWHDKATGASGQGGLVSGAIQGLDRSIAYDSGVGGLFATWPER